MPAKVVGYNEVVEGEVGGEGVPLKWGIPFPGEGQEARWVWCQVVIKSIAAVLAGVKEIFGSCVAVT